MIGPLTDAETQLIRIYSLRRTVLFVILFISIILLVIFFFSTFKLEEWSFEYFLSTTDYTPYYPFIGLLGVFGLIGALRFISLKESIHYVRIAVEPSQFSKEEAHSKFSTIFSEISKELIKNTPKKVMDKLENNGWPVERAKYFVSFAYIFMMAQQFGGILTEDYLKRFIRALEKDGWDDKWILGACEGIEDVFDEAGGVHTARAQLAIYFTYGIIIFFAVILSLFKLYIYYNR